jgi:hypothetical protein
MCLLPPLNTKISLHLKTIFLYNKKKLRFVFFKHNKQKHSQGTKDLNNFQLSSAPRPPSERYFVRSNKLYKDGFEI